MELIKSHILEKQQGQVPVKYALHLTPVKYVSTQLNQASSMFDKRNSTS